ncbi:hypothetical protein FNV43_RR13971 [Rhamnella rubrinervis]|uniref:Autophagy protein 5 n=1 Tax=Rhamnella rubrinervis TaxID=2594499 RepID=A0A8K0H210_9ROSA|nr:hypothetical protein FNV43_RR13971 [Rhamnella rubrinervis]
MEAQKLVWEGAIPLQIHLHESEVTTVPAPPPALILAPRIGYLPLLASLIKPHFSGTLPPGADTIWFEYNGLPLKWYIPTGVLFDLLSAEPERPWNLTVHFRGYPGSILIPCEGEESIKWSFINSLKEAAHIITGNCKNVMNMSQPDQVELWRSVLNVNLEAYLRVSSKLKLGIIGNQYTATSNLQSSKSGQSLGETDATGNVKIGRVPVRLYVRFVSEDIDDLEDAPHVDSWEKISYINRAIEIQGEGKCFTLRDALKSLLPEYFPENFLIDEEPSSVKGEDEQRGSTEDASDTRTKEGGEDLCEYVSACCQSVEGELKFVRIQGIEPKLETPFTWVVTNLINPDHFLHIIVLVKVPQLTV